MNNLTDNTLQKTAHKKAEKVLNQTLSAYRFMHLAEFVHGLQNGFSGEFNTDDYQDMSLAELFGQRVLSLSSLSKAKDWVRIADYLTQWGVFADQMHKMQEEIYKIYLDMRREGDTQAQKEIRLFIIQRCLGIVPKDHTNADTKEFKNECFSYFKSLFANRDNLFNAYLKKNFTEIEDFINNPDYFVNNPNRIRRIVHMLCLGNYLKKINIGLGDLPYQLLVIFDKQGQKGTEGRTHRWKFHEFSAKQIDAVVVIVNNKDILQSVKKELESVANTQIIFPIFTHVCKLYYP